MIKTSVLSSGSRSSSSYNAVLSLFMLPSKYSDCVLVILSIQMYLMPARELTNQDCKIFNSLIAFWRIVLKMTLKLNTQCCRVIVTVVELKILRIGHQNNFVWVDEHFFSFDFSMKPCTLIRKIVLSRWSCCLRLRHEENCNKMLTFADLDQTSERFDWWLSESGQCSLMLKYFCVWDMRMNESAEQQVRVQNGHHRSPVF